MSILSTVSSEEPIDIGSPKDEYALLERGEESRRPTDASFANTIKSPSSGASSFSKSTTSQDETRLWEMEAYIFWMAYARKQSSAQGDPTAKKQNGVSVRAFERLYVERERAISLKRKIDAYFRPRLNLAERKTTKDNFPIDFEEFLFHWNPWYPSQPCPYSRLDNIFGADGILEQLTDYYTSEGYWGIELLTSEMSDFDSFKPLTKIGAEKHLFDN
ncbi:hypothetical protein DL764_000625 [Monosporascus ibericus]|uniref:Uncharacterized protein n=1 Tax=Monosporascus ibericus TaxID=155417 RepID=A0A4Q4TUA9_9PEZI|nr:hypothetical protein DL764_000625 [Monosporascus ibericus]